MPLDTRRPPIGALLLLLGVVAVTIVLILQNTKQAMLPAKQTPVLWAAETAVMLGVLVLRSGWGRDSGWRQAQEAIGTLANNYYAPRRSALTAGTAIGVGVFGGLWWSVATWAVMFNAMRHGAPTRGIADFEVAALMGAITGGVIGAVIGLAAGHVWEARHRRRRLTRKTADA
jgi:hypothetical protein